MVTRSLQGTYTLPCTCAVVTTDSSYAQGHASACNKLYAFVQAPNLSRGTLSTARHPPARAHESEWDTSDGEFLGDEESAAESDFEDAEHVHSDRIGGSSATSVARQDSFR